MAEQDLETRMLRPVKDILPTVGFQHYRTDDLLLTYAGNPLVYLQKVPGIQGRLILQDGVYRCEEFDELIYRTITLVRCMGLVQARPLQIVHNGVL